MARQSHDYKAQILLFHRFVPPPLLFFATHFHLILFFFLSFSLFPCAFALPCLLTFTFSIYQSSRFDIILLSRLFYYPVTLFAKGAIADGSIKNIRAKDGIITYLISSLPTKFTTVVLRFPLQVRQKSVSKRRKVRRGNKYSKRNAGRRKHEKKTARHRAYVALATFPHPRKVSRRC